jgi:stage II sporulation protein M
MILVEYCYAVIQVRRNNMGLKQRLKQHISTNRWQYGLITIIFIIAVMMGNYRVESLEGGVKEHLAGLLDNNLQEGGMSALTGQQLLVGAFMNQVRTAFAIWFLGLTIIGFPLILAVLFYRGFSLGFTVGFLVHQKAGAGILISILSLLPQNLIYIPALLMWAVISLNFSVNIFRGRGANALSWRSFLSYSFTLLLFLLIFLGGFY